MSAAGHAQQRSQHHGLRQNPPDAAALDGISHDQIDLQTESFAQIVLQACKLKQTDTVAQIHQHIQVTVRRLLAADV